MLFLLVFSAQINQLDPADIEGIVGVEGHLGYGSFGVVRVAFHSGIGPVAVKCIEYRGGEKSKRKFGKK